MAAGRLSSAELTEAYLRRIERLNPVLHAVIETNPDAPAIAARRDAQRRAGRARGPLHGIPVLVKDNIATRDAMETTAGSLALVGSRVPRDARLVARLRDAGAVILGKANLSEWANFRGLVPPAVKDAGLHLNGWSARGGSTRNPYGLAWDPCGSSSGSAVAPAANLCAFAIGTETDGSIVCPSGSNARRRPQADRRPGRPGRDHPDLAQPGHGRTDDADRRRRGDRPERAALAVRRRRRRAAAARLPGVPAPRGAARRADRASIGGCSTGDPGADPALNAVAEAAFDTMRSLGATLVDPIEPVDTKAIADAELTVLFSEFKVSMAAYLGGLRGTTMRTLADLIAFNDAHCEDELRWFGQELFDVAEATTGLDDPAYRAARALCLEVTRARGIDRILADGHLDAIVAPAYGDSSAAAVAGYPSISVPTGVDGRRPARRRLALRRAAGRADAPRPRLRSRSGGRRAAATALHRVDPGRAAGCRAVRHAHRRTPAVPARGPARGRVRTAPPDGRRRHLSSSRTKEVP